jgi:hypothetical protein
MAGRGPGAVRPWAGVCVALCLLLAACAGRAPDVPVAAPIASVPAEASAGVPAVPDTAPAQAEPKRGFLGFLRRDRGRTVADPDAGAIATEAVVDATGAEATPSAETGAAPAPAVVLDAAPEAGDAPGTADVAKPSRRPRLFGGVFRRTPGEVRNRATADAPPAAAARVDTAVGPGVLLPFGQVAKVCGLSVRGMGTEVDESRGASTYRLFDTSPSSTGPRTQFLTGFKDGCARQFTASLALFGSAEVHEATRYNPLNTNPYSPTDDAYERIKTRICGVGRGQFCPEARIARLSRDTAFVSVYRSFGGTDTWLELFLYKGDLVAHQTLSP